MGLSGAVLTTTKALSNKLSALETETEIEREGVIDFCFLARQLLPCLRDMNIVDFSQMVECVVFVDNYFLELL